MGAFVTTCFLEVLYPFSAELFTKYAKLRSGGSENAYKVILNETFGLFGRSSGSESALRTHPGAGDIVRLVLEGNFDDSSCHLGAH